MLPLLDIIVACAVCTLSNGSCLLTWAFLGFPVPLVIGCPHFLTCWSILANRCGYSSMQTEWSCNVQHPFPTRRLETLRSLPVAVAGHNACKSNQRNLLQRRRQHPHAPVRSRSVCACTPSKSQADVKQLSQNLPESREQAVSLTC